jgi:transcriptional regulator with XRE-family HTH domain
MTAGDVETPHAGEELRSLRERAGMTVEEVAARAGVDPGWLAELESGTGTREVLYSQWVELVKATQPPRPQWWDEGHEHDLSLPPDGHHDPTTDTGRRYWDRIAAVRAEIEAHYRRG